MTGPQAEPALILSDNARGVIFMSIAMAAFTCNDTLMKAVTQSVPLMEAITVRGLIASVLLLMLGHLLGGVRLGLPKADRGLLFWRTLAELAGTLTFLSALMHMPLANLAAIMQSLPLAVTLAAALFLAEPVGWRRMAAIAVGFTGVLLIVRPGTEGFDVWSVVGVISVLFVVLRDLVTRRLTPGLPSITVAFYTSVGVTLMGVAGMVVGGEAELVRLAAWELLYLSAASIMIVVGYLFIIKAMRAGDVAIVAPFRYTSLLFAIIAAAQAGAGRAIGRRNVARRSPIGGPGPC